MLMPGADSAVATLPSEVREASRTNGRATSLEQNQKLDNFLASVERRALRMATIATGNPDDALDIVQDAMMKLASHYGNRDAAQWPPLFHRILQNGITDWRRRRSWSRRWRQWFGPKEDGEEDDIIDVQPDRHTPLPERELQQGETLSKLEKAIQQLPPRQQQALMLRLWEGLDVADTATAMGCSQGSVKTHYSRAVHTLREKLEGSWP